MATVNVTSASSAATLVAANAGDAFLRNTGAGIVRVYHPSLAGQIGVQALEPGEVLAISSSSTAVTGKLRELEAAGQKSEAVAIGNKGLGFMNRVGAKVVSHVTGLGDTPHLDKLIGPVKVLLDAYAAGEVSAVYLCYNKFVSTMAQVPTIDQLLPLSSTQMEADTKAAGAVAHGWDYIYEPDAQSVIDELLVRYAEALAYQAVAENMASEHAARMVAMKAATDNAGNVIGELKLVYNKTRQAAITKELSEIVSGAAAISG